MLTLKRALDDIKVGSQGDILPLDSGYNGLTFYDRQLGAVIGCHNATGGSSSGSGTGYTVSVPSGSVAVSPCYAWGYGSASMPNSIWWWGSPQSDTGYTYPADPAPIGNGGVLGMPRTDGYTDGTDTLQGVRGMDMNSSTWTTPDAFAGMVENPASQKSYMWNGNNPVSYSDPSGYIWGYIDPMFWQAFIAWAQTPDGQVVHNQINNDPDVTVNIYADSASQLGGDGTLGAVVNPPHTLASGRNGPVSGSLKNHDISFGNTINEAICTCIGGKDQLDHQAEVIGHESYHADDMIFRPNEFWNDMTNSKGYKGTLGWGDDTNPAEHRALVYQTKIEHELHDTEGYSYGGGL